MNMIEDAVTQLKAGIDRARTAQRRLYVTNQRVVVRSTKIVRGHERTTWSSAVVVGAAVLNGTWVYRIRRTDGRGRHTYGIVGQSGIKAA